MKTFFTWGGTPPTFRLVKDAHVIGFSHDRRKRRRQHRKAAKVLLSYGSSIFNGVAAWHLYQARHL